MPRHSWRCCLLALVPVHAEEGSPSVSHILQGPLTQFLLQPDLIDSHTRSLTVRVQVQRAPADFGMGLFLSDKDGLWFQIPAPGPLTIGRHVLHFSLDDALPMSEPGVAAWLPSEMAHCRRYGLFSWSAHADSATVVIEDWQHYRAPRPPEREFVLQDIVCAGMDANTGMAYATTGERWEVRCRPEPFPHNPFDPDEFRIDAHIVTPSGRTIIRPGFYYQPYDFSDRGDVDMGTSAGAADFRVRFRPREPGVHHVTLHASWGADTHQVNLPPLDVNGEPWDQYVRVDEKDPRFLATGDGAFFWAPGANLRSVYDMRGNETLGTKVPANRILFANQEYVERFAAAGARHLEIWLAAWNVALEWNPGRRISRPWLDEYGECRAFRSHVRSSVGAWHAVYLSRE